METFSNSTISYNDTTSTGDERCYFVCNVYCIVDIVLITVGILANGLVVLMVVRDKDLKNPTFVAIASLAVADICFMIGYFAANEIECPLETPAYKTGETAIVAIYILTWFISAMHILLLSVIRFLLILYPLTSMSYLTVRKTVFMSAGIWIVGVMIGIIDGVLYVLKELGIVGRNSVMHMFIVIICGSYFIPLLATIILHVIKLKEVSKVIKAELPAHVRQMALMVAITLLLFTILPLPQVVTLFVIFFRDDLEFLDDPGIEWCLSLGLLLNSCVNPFVYAIFSQLFRKCLRKRFCKRMATDKNRSRVNSSCNHGFHTEETNCN